MKRVLPTFAHGGPVEIVLHHDAFVVIARAVSGNRRRYNAIRVGYDGQATCVGNELPLAHARKCAEETT